ncbi:signal peptidase I [uncultured Proteiniphilum sp.]|uniref:signal peptidase I n=1 Tax=uncultured Proteiniphilum sp. TaxID=497637 RepID=UPI0026334876|nr:signal peptidase I [uncultured Proteiniphilum sp.]
MKVKKTTRSIIQWIFIILGAIVLAVSLRVFIFDTYTIPTPSMEPAIMSGDHVVVNKLVPGPRIIRNFFSLGKGVKPVFTRLTGWKVERNDVLIFNFPYSDRGRMDLDMNLFYAKRCVAVPGDTFYIENGFYKVKHVSDTLGYHENQRILSERPDHEFAPEIFHCFPYDSHHTWSIKNFGPVYIPEKGSTMPIDTLNAIIYRNLITYETRKPVSVKNGTVVLGDSVISEYTFNRNYYFMAGDYVFDSQDSRYWGLLPEDHITGKVSFVWNTKDMRTGKIRWNRFLKKVK